MDLVDTTSIIENKQTTKEYWERRMMEDQALSEGEVILKNSKAITGKVAKEIGNDKSYHLNGNLAKLGSDGESEASPDCSLSPVEVDSLEEAGSDGSQSPVTSQVNGQVDFSFASKDDNCGEKYCKTMVLDQYSNHHADLEERDELEPVIEEEHETDSLEEFIKHENECKEEEGKCENLCETSEKKVDMSNSKDNLSQCLMANQDKDEKLNSNLKYNVESNFKCEQMSGDLKPMVIGEVFRHSSATELELMENEAKVSVESVKAKFLSEDATSESVKRTAKSAEFKIAEEIRELKEREEELIKMRQKLHHSSSVETASSVSSVTLDDSFENISTSPSCSSFSNSCDHLTNLDISSISQCSVNESPIEKEIRSLNEREEELRIRKGYVNTLSKLESGSPDESRRSRPRVSENKSNQLPLFKQNTCGINNSADIQKLLATTRIQQEIEEQTQREMALKATGSIKTISQERTDIKVAKLGQMEKPSLKSNSMLNCEKVAKSESSQVTLTNSALIESILTKKPTVSSIFQIGKAKTISMHKFISSKGKAIHSNAPLSTTLSPARSGYSHYQDLKPPQMIKGEKNFKRRSITAESKIQEELKEMKVREDELRRQRARLLGLSQPNLNMVGEKEDEETNHDLDSEKAKMKRTASNPNINEERKVCQALGGLKKKNPLISQWEEKINQNLKKEEKIVQRKT